MASLGTVQVRGLYTDIFESRLPYIDEILMDRFDPPSMMYPEVYNVRDSNRYAEEMTEITGYGQFAKKPENEKIEYDSKIQGFDKRLKPDSWAKGAMVSFELMEDDVDNAISDTIPDLATSANYSIETEAAATYNNAFGTELTADGLSLINSAHVLVAGGTFSNTLGAVDFSQGALESAMNIFHDFRNGRNQHVVVNARKLLAHPDQQWLIEEVLQSQQRSDTANNATNVVRRLGLQPVYWRYLTDKDMFFLLADPSDLRVMFYWRREPFSDSALDFDTRSMKTAMLYRLSRGAIDWRGVVGAQGA